MPDAGHTPPPPRRQIEQAVLSQRRYGSQKGPSDRIRGFGGAYARPRGALGECAVDIGAGTDSVYEYLLKGYLLFGDELYLTMFEQVPPGEDKVAATKPPTTCTPVAFQHPILKQTSPQFSKF